MHRKCTASTCLDCKLFAPVESNEREPSNCETFFFGDRGCPLQMQYSAGNKDKEQDMSETTQKPGPSTLRRVGAEIWKGDHVVALACGNEAEADDMIQSANTAPDLLEALHAIEKEGRAVADIMHRIASVEDPLLDDRLSGLWQAANGARAAIARAQP